MSESLEALAENLWRVRTSGGQVPVAAAAELATVEDAYRVQRLVEARASMPRFGWKVGATSEAAQRSLDSDGPVSAPMHAPFCFESPALVSVFPGQAPASSASSRSASAATCRPGPQPTAWTRSWKPFAALSPR